MANKNDLSQPKELIPSGLPSNFGINGIIGSEDFSLDLAGGPTDQQKNKLLTQDIENRFMAMQRNLPGNADLLKALNPSGNPNNLLNLLSGIPGLPGLFPSNSVAAALAAAAFANKQEPQGKPDDSEALDQAPESANNAQEFKNEANGSNSGGELTF